VLQLRLAQFRYDDQVDKAFYQVALSSCQRFAGDVAGSKVTAQQARDGLEGLYKDQPDSAFSATLLAQAYAELGEKDQAVRAAERAIMLASKDSAAEYRPMQEEALTMVQIRLGHRGAAISTLKRLLQTPYNGWFLGPPPVTPALLRLDPIWDPLRAVPAFQKLCAEKQP